MASVRAIKRARSISKSGINCTSATRFNSASILQPCDFAFFLIVCSLLRDAGSATSLSSDFMYYRGGTGESSIFLGAAVSHLEGTETSQRAAVWESTGPPPWLRGGIWLYPDEHNQF